MKRKTILLLSLFSVLISMKAIAQITFTKQNTSPISPTAFGITNADFNEDTHLDIAYSNGADTVVVQLGVGDGTFGTKRYTSINPGGVLVSSFGFDQADVDSDGHIDLIITSEHRINVSPFTPSYYVSVLYGKGDGSFDPVQDYSTAYPPIAHAADMDNDGEVDLVTNSDRILYNDGSGSRTFTNVDSTNNITGWDFQLVNLNGDSYMDAVSASVGTALNVYIGGPGGTFTTSQIFVETSLPASAQTNLFGLELIDINRDGNLDIVAYNYYTPSSSSNFYHLYTYYGNGSGGFSGEKRYYLGSVDEIDGIESGDFNGDGLNDIVVAHGSGTGFYYLLGKPNGDFASPVSDSRTGFFFYGFLPLTAGDFNEDGSCDFAGGDYGTVYISNDTTGASIIINGTIPSVLCPGSSVSVPFAEAGTFHTGNIFTVQLSDSSGSFSSPTAIGTLDSTAGDTIQVIVPNNAIAGTHYRIRIVSSDRVAISPNNGTNIQIPIVPAQPHIRTAFLEFDGIDDRVTVSPSPSTTYNTSGTGANLSFTIEGWVKASSSQNTEATIYSKRATTSSGFWFGLNSNGELTSHTSNVVFNSTGTYTLNVAINDNSWHHVAVTRSNSGKDITYFVDGEEVGKDKTSVMAIFNTNFNSTHDIWIGDDGGVTGNTFTGGIKGLRYWKTALTDIDLQALWKTNLNKYTSTNLIGYWDMNDSTGQVQTDRSNSANNGYLGSNSGASDSRDPLIDTVNAVPYTINALLFDANDDYVDVSHISTYDLGTGNFTIESWIKADASFNDQTIFSNRTNSTTGLWLGLDGSGILTLKINSTTIASTSIDLQDIGWKHVAVTRSGSTITFYVDGVPAGTGSSSGSITTSHDVWIGNDVNSSVGFGGLIDEVRFWKIARSQNDIFTNKTISNVNCFTSSDLIGFWRFNATSGQTDVDLSPIGHNGLLGSTSGVDLTDPLRIADAAFIGARKGYFSKTTTESSQASGMQISTYPNPFTGNVNILISNLESGEAVYTIYTTTGLEVSNGTVADGETISIGNGLDAGVYILKVIEQSNTKTSRLIKY
jgi:hypothetical protein